MKSITNIKYIFVIVIINIIVRNLINFEIIIKNYKKVFAIVVSSKILKSLKIFSFHSEIHQEYIIYVFARKYWNTVCVQILNFETVENCEECSQFIHLYLKS